jgi:hypothetical protein
MVRADEGVVVVMVLMELEGEWGEECLYLQKTRFCP